MFIWIAGAIIVVLLLICLSFMIKHFHDSPSSSITEDEKYRAIVGRSVHKDFEGVWEQLIDILDGIREGTRYAVPTVANYDFQQINAFFENGQDIYNRCLNMQKMVKDIWTNKKYTKDFYFFVALHYASRNLGQILSAEYHNLKMFADEAESLYHNAEVKLEAARKEHLESEDFERRRELNRDMDKTRKQMEDLLNLKTQFAEIVRVYAIRIERQNHDTLQRANFIGTSFKRQGPEWRESMQLRSRHQ